MFSFFRKQDLVPLVLVFLRMSHIVRHINAKNVLQFVLAAAHADIHVSYPDSATISQIAPDIYVVCVLPYHRLTYPKWRTLIQVLPPANAYTKSANAYIHFEKCLPVLPELPKIPRCWIIL